MLRRMRKLELLGRARSSLCRATPQSWPIRPLKMMQRKTDMALRYRHSSPWDLPSSDSGGRPESYPSPSRLYSALVSAAYLTFGFETPNADCGLTDEQIHAALDCLKAILRRRYCFLASLALGIKLWHTGTREMSKTGRNLKTRNLLRRPTSPLHTSSIPNREWC